MLGENSIAKLNQMFNLFSGISANYSGMNMQTIFGKALCGPDFSFSLESYGYTVKTTSFEMPPPKGATTSPPSNRSSTVTPFAIKDLIKRDVSKEKFDQRKILVSLIVWLKINLY